MTYYKYAERDATSRVNWSDVSKKWTDEINQIADDRDKKRTEIQTATDELSDKLLNAPMGENKGINSFTANLSEMSTQYLLDANRKLKSGDIKPRDYMELMSNLKQGTSALYDTAKKYSDVYGEKMERLRNGDSQPMEAFLMANAEAMGNFTESNPIINPSNGMLSVYDSTGRTMSVPRMNAAIVSQYDYYDYETEMAQRADQLGKVINVIMESDVKTLEQARQMEGYTKVEDDYLDAALEDGLHVSSLLTVDMPGYNLSDDASKAGDNDVLLVLHPRQPSTGIMVPLYDFVDDIAAMESSQQEAKLDEIFGSDLSNEERANLLRIAGEQKKEAREFLRRDLRSRQDEIETPQAEFADTGGGGRGPTKSQLDYAQLTDRVQLALDNWMALQYATTPAEKEKSEEAIVGQFYQGKEVVGADVTSGDVKLTLKDGDTISIERTSADGTDFNPVQWAEQGNFLYEDPAIARALIRQRQAGENAYGSMTDVLAGRPAFVQQTIPNFLEKKVTTEGGEEKKVSEVVAALPTVGPIGDIDNANEAVTQLKSMFSDLKLLDADVRAHDEETVVKAGQDSSDNSDYPAISIYLPRQMEVPVVIPAYQEAYDSFFNALAVAMERGITLTEAEVQSMLYDGAKGYNSEEIRKELGLTSSTRRTSTGGGKGAARKLYTTGG